MATAAVTTDTYDLLVGRLGRARRLWRRLRMVGALGWWLAALTAVVMACLALDNWLHLGAGARVGLVVGTGLVTIGTAVVLVGGWGLRRLGDDQLAIYLERRLPDIDGRLINAIQIGRNGHGAARPFVDALVSESYQYCRPYDFQRAVDRRPARYGLLTGGLLLVAMGLYGVCFPEHFLNAGQRLLAPHRDILPVGVPRLVVEPGDQRVVAGKDLAVTAWVANDVSVEHMAIWIEAPDGRADRFLLKPNTEDRYQYVCRQVTQDFTYRIETPAAKTRAFQVTVLQPPAISRLELRYVFPAYTRLVDRTESDASGDIRALAGTTVHVRVHADQALGRAQLVCRSGLVQELTLRDGLVAEGALTVRQADRYRIRLVSQAYEVPLESPEHLIEVVPDRRPTVSIPEPGRHVTAAPADKVVVAVRAADDFGLRRLALCCKLGEAKPQVVHAWDLAQTAQSVTRRWTWALADLKLARGDVVTYWAVATDANDIAGPGQGESERLQITIGSADQKRHQVKAAREEAARSLLALLQKQKNNRRTTCETGTALAARRTLDPVVRQRVGTVADTQVDIRKDALMLAARFRKARTPQAGDLQRLASGEMVRAVEHLDTARTKTDTATVVRALTLGTESQQKIIDTLEAIIRRRGQMQSAASLAAVLRRLGMLLKNQKGLRANTGEGTLALGALAPKQAQLQQETTDLTQTMHEAAKLAEPMQKDLCQALTAAAGQMTSRGIAPTMGKACAALRGNARAEAITHEDKAIADIEAVIKELGRLLAESAEKKRKKLLEAARKSAEKADKMAKIEKQIDTLSRDIDKLPKDHRDKATDKLDKLAKMQKDLKDAAEKSAEDAKKLPPHDATNDMVKCWEEVRKHLEASEEALKKKITEKVVKANKDILKKLMEASKVSKDAENTLDKNPDRTKWKLEDFKPEDIPKMPVDKLPEKLKDLIGNLIEEEEDPASDDETSNWMKRSSESGLGIDGPMSTFGAKGITGNRKPDPAELSGRSGAGRSGKASGEMVEGETKKLEGGTPTPRRRTPDSYQKGQVKDKDPESPSGGTGGGKRSSLGEQGLTGKYRPDQKEDLKGIYRKQTQIRRETQRLGAHLQLMNLPVGQLPRAVELMKQIEDDIIANRLSGVPAKRKAAVVALKNTLSCYTGGSIVETTAGQTVSPTREALEGALDQGLPKPYEALLKRYYEKLSEAGEP